MNEVKLYIKDNGNKEFETMRDLIEQIEHDRKWYKENDSEEKFLNSPIILQLSDYEGQIIEGKMHMAVGSVIDDTFVLVGNIDGIIFEKGCIVNE